MSVRARDTGWATAPTSPPAEASRSADASCDDGPGGVVPGSEGAVRADPERPDVLARACEGLKGSLEAREEFPDPGRAGALLDDLVNDVRLLLERRGAVGFSRQDDAPIRLRLIDLLRARLVAEWGASESPSPQAMLRMLEVLDELRVAAEPGGRHRIELDLGDPTSLGLVVEMAHDLRSPLTSILFLAEVLRSGRSGPLTDLQRGQLGVVYSAAFALTSVADDLIELSRRGEAPGSETPVPFSLAELVEDVARMLRPMADAKAIEFRISTPREDRRLGRPVALSRVLVNLATNALKFTEEGFVEVRAETEGFDSIRFAVTDSGRGIPREAQATLFETFRKSRQRRGFFFSGSGLGLNIARRLVEEMGGRLDYESRADHGTVFHFTLRAPPAHL